MTVVSLKLIGVQEVLKNITEETVKIEKKISDGIDIVRIKIADDARRLAPVDTGALRASIHSVRTGPYTAFIADNVYYGIFCEMGTRYMKPRPFMRPALESNKMFIKRTFEEALP